MMAFVIYISIIEYTFICIIINTVNVSGTTVTRGQRIAIMWSKVIYSLCNIIIHVLAHAQNSRQKASLLRIKWRHIQLKLILKNVQISL